MVSEFSLLLLFNDSTAVLSNWACLVSCLARSSSSGRSISGRLLETVEEKEIELEIVPPARDFRVPSLLSRSPVPIRQFSTCLTIIAARIDVKSSTGSVNRNESLLCCGKVQATNTDGNEIDCQVSACAGFRFTHHIELFCGAFRGAHSLSIKRYVLHYSVLASQRG